MQPHSQSHFVNVIDGPVPSEIFDSPEMEPSLRTPPELAGVHDELLRREPIFHREEFGTTRDDFEKMTAPEFWEVGASGRRFSRKFVLDTLEPRYQNRTHPIWEIRDFHCQQIAPDNFLATYTLIQPLDPDDRITRRSTIWRRTPAGWQIVFHQGTEVASDRSAMRRRRE